MQNYFQAPTPKAQSTICITPTIETVEAKAMQAPPNAQAVTLLIEQAHHRIRRRSKIYWGAIAALVAIYAAAVFMMRVFNLDALNADGKIFLVPTMGAMFVIGGVALRHALRPMGY